MPFECKEVKIKIFFVENVFITDEIDQKPQYHIASAGSSIAKGLQAYDPAEWRIKKINDREYEIPGAMYMSAHRWAQR